jgi:DNA polymerase III epsilon subunit-like protein
MRTTFNPEADAFDEFTRRVFVVVDTETTLPPERKGPQRLVSYAYTVLDSTTGFKSEKHHVFVNPGVPMDPKSTSKNGITTEMLVKKKDFKFHHAKLKAVLQRPDVIFVAHNANFDAGVLRNEFELIGVPFPDVPVIDTMYLPATVGFSVSGARGTPSLELLCELLGVVNKSPHTANADADATASVLLGLLRHASANITDTPSSKGTGIATLDELLFIHGRGTTLTLKPSVYISDRDKSSAYQLDPVHKARHSVRLDSAPTTADIDEWVDRAVECARLRCPLLNPECEAAKQHGGVLLKRLWGPQADLTEPGQYATLVGGMMRLLNPASPGSAMVEQSAALHLRSTSMRIIHGMPRLP